MLAQSVCVGILALGSQYRLHAKLLAFDLLYFHPEIEVILLTDEPDSFQAFPNVHAIKHKSSGIRACYHEKRFVFSEAFKRYDACLFLDADSRLLSAINFAEMLESQAFIYAFVASNLSKKINDEIEDSAHTNGFNSPYRKKKIFQNLAKRLSVNFESVIFVQESAFFINSKYGNYPSFKATWDYCAIYTTARLFEFSEGSSIGISTLKSGGNIYLSQRLPDWYFKDLYTDDRGKNEEQKLLARQLVLLRLALSKEKLFKQNKAFMFLKAIGSMMSFYYKNVSVLLK